MAGGITAAVIGGTAMIGSSLMSSQAAKSAANTQAAAADRAAAAQQPFLDNGYVANNRLMELLGLSPNTNAPGYGSANQNFTAADLYAGMDPGYAFRISEVNKALNATAAARGGMISGNALKAAQDYGQGAASQEYTNAFNRYQTNRSNLLNPLQSLSGQGLTTAGNVGNLGMQSANALASGQIGSANAINNGISQGLSSYQNYNLMNKLFPASNAMQMGAAASNQYGAGNVYGYGGQGTVPNGGSLLGTMDQ